MISRQTGGHIRADGLWPLARQEIAPAATMLAGAFSADPLWQWVVDGLPRPDSSRQAAFEAVLRYCRRYGEVCSVTARLEAVAAWLPGRFADMGFGRMIASGAVWAGLRLGFVAAQRMRVPAAMLAADRRAHTAGRHYLYLAVIGVAPEAQRQGLAGRLLRALLAEADQARQPVYLETEAESNVGLYERFGFRVLKRIAIPPAALPVWEMLREPA